MDKSTDFDRLVKIMDRTRFIRIDNGVETVKEFDGVSKYDGLSVSDVIEVVCEDDAIRDYYVSEIKWDFTHFGNTLVITILPVKPKPQPTPVTGDHGEIIGFIKS